ncbi:MAG: hypothetical protein IPK54_03880 [Dokdonella sp.]|uniref:hypothetical protein n=1 Tax=Dokdonella sp. TaxID=2291710 RepID=UPI0025C15DD1|nr:hypothetical protein [Dokdonella sp.]MBK8122700.1 hypothetical protein [Dokdonella sp.]
MTTLQRNRGWRAAAGALMASSLVLLGGCGKQTTPVPETQGTTPVAAEPAKPDADARFEIISARAEMSARATRAHPGIPQGAGRHAIL